MLTDAWTKLRPHPQQRAALACTDRFVALVAGRGSGKTEIARRRVVSFLPVGKPWPQPQYFYALPTYKQAMKIAWEPLLSLIPKQWIAKVRISENYIDTVFGSRLWIIGLDKAERAEGIQYDGGVIDESCDVKPGVFERTFVPALTHRNGWCWRIGVAKRFGVGAAEYKKFFDKGLTPGSGVSSFTWPSSDILTPEQLAWAKSTLNETDFNEQFNATWETIGGGVFHAFSDSNIREVKYDKNLPIIVGSDFNVNPMAWVLGHVINGEYHVFDELFIRNTNTPNTLKILALRYPDHGAGWVFHGDASGKARKTAADLTDYLHIEQCKLFVKKKVVYPKSNPPRPTRFSATNSALCSADGIHRIYISPKCVNLLNDLRYRNYKEGTREPDDKGDLGHASDALGYVVMVYFPPIIEMPQGAVSSIGIIRG